MMSGAKTEDLKSGPEAASESAGAPKDSCPRCHTTVSWGQSSWCPQCGFYPAVDTADPDGKSWADSLPQVPDEEQDTGQSVLQTIPVWFWIMMGGVLGIMAFSVAMRLMFPDEESPRGMIAIAQLIVGLLCTVVAHIVASRAALSADRRVNLTDVLVNWFSVWQPTITCLPGTCRRVWFVVWGGVAMLTATTIIGGIDYSAPFRTEPKEVPKVNMLGAAVGAITGAAREKADGAASLDDALAQVSDPSQMGLDEDGMPGDLDEQLAAIGAAGEMTLEELEEMKKFIARGTMNCTIYGVVTDSRSVPTSFLFCGEFGERLFHVAEIRAADLPPEQFRIIAVRLYTAVRPEPMIPSELEAVWVEPKVTCRLQFESISDDHIMQKPEFQAIVVNQPGVIP